MKSLPELSPRELELIWRNIAKANPPQILWRYRRATPWTIKELSVPEVHVACVADMNDPFEYRAPVAVDGVKLKAAFYSYARRHLRLQHGEAQTDVDAVTQVAVDQAVNQLLHKLGEVRSFSGVVCCSGNPRSNRMWAYYGDSHKGICIGYDTQYSPFCVARKVRYADPQKPIDLMETLAADPTDLSDHISCRKGGEWAFEDEYRVPIGPFSEDQTRLIPVNPDAVVEIRLGSQISEGFRNEVLEAARQLPKIPRILQMGCDFDSFCLTESDVRLK